MSTSTVEPIVGPPETPQPAEPAKTAGAGLAGVVATGLALGTAELIAGIADPSVSSPVIAIGEFVIKIAPGDAIRAGNQAVGSNNKPLLLTGIVLVSLGLGWAAGRFSARHHIRLIGFFAPLAFVAVAAGARQALTSVAPMALAMVVSAGVGAACGLYLLKVASRVPDTPSTGGSAGSIRPALDVAFDAPPASRRQFLRLAAAGSVLAGLFAFGGRRLRNASTVERARDALVLPEATTTDAVASAASEVGAGDAVGESITTSLDSTPGITPYIVANDDFYRIDTALSVPRVDPATWSLKITGMVDNEITLTLDDILAMDLVEETVTLSCVSNSVGGDLVGNAVWRGVPLQTLLAQAGVKPGAEQIATTSVDGWTAGFPIETAFDGRTAMLAIAMNGEPLPEEHGFPARLVVAGLYGYVSATKWIDKIEITTWDDFTGYWIPRGWSERGPIKTQSRIDAPRGRDIAPGQVAIGGVAWAPTRGISKVEVRVDEGEWVEAELGEVVSDNTWVQWRRLWDATSGEHRITVRATDGDGVTQTETRTDVAPDGATGWDTVRVKIA